ncbi:MAG: DNA-processing protein DprA [Clostridium sp.]
MDLLRKLWFTNVNVDKNVKLQLIDEGVNLNSLYGYSYEKLLKLCLSSKDIEAIEISKNPDYYNNVAKYLEKEKIRFIFIGDKEYPEYLRNTFNPPTGLFIKGQEVNFNNCIAVVGARRASEYGKNTARSISKTLSEHGLTVVSGIALGIDAASHIGAIEGGGKTIGVIGSGHMHRYPSTNSHIYDQIESNGAVISEYFPEVIPFKTHFPERNRIISGLSKGTVVVEAAQKSGSLITAALSLQEGREVYAVPGNITSKNSCGTNSLIREGAKVVLDPGDILEDFGIELNNSVSYDINLSTEEKRILSVLTIEELSFEDLFLKSSMERHKLISILTKMECTRLIKRVYGNTYSVC